MSENDLKIEKLIKKTRNRICKVTFYKSLLFVITLGFCVWGLFQLIALFVPFYGAKIFGSAAFLVVLIAGVIITVNKYPTLKQAAIKLDSAGYKERVLTAMELKGKNDVFSNLQKEDAIEATKQISLKKTFPFNIKWKMFLFAFLSFLFVLSTAMIPAKSKDIAEENHILKQEISEAEEELEDLVAEMIDTRELSDEEITKLEEYLDEAKQELKEAENVNEIDKIKERFENKMYTSIGEEAPNNAKQEAMAIENALNEARNGNLSIKDQEEIADRLDELAEKNQDEEMERLAQEMQQELENDGQLSNDTIAQAQQSLQPYIQSPVGPQFGTQQQGGQQGQQTQQGNQQGQQGGQDGQQGGQQSGGQQGGQNGQQGGQQSGGQQGGQDGQQGGQQSGGQQGGQDGQQGGQQSGGQQGQQGGQDGQQGGQQGGQDGQQGGQDGQQGGQDGQQGGQDGQQGGQDGQQGGQDGQQGGQDGQQGGQQGGQGGQQGGQGGQEGQQGGQQGGQGGQQGGQQGAQQGGQNSQGGQQGSQGGQQGGQGGGWDTGSKIGQESAFQGGGERVMVSDQNSGPNQFMTGQANSQGSSQLTPSQNAQVWAGENVQYEQVIGDYTRQAYDNMNQSQIPDSMKDMVKEYFSNLN